MSGFPRCARGALVMLLTAVPFGACESTATQPLERAEALEEYGGDILPLTDPPSLDDGFYWGRFPSQNAEHVTIGTPPARGAPPWLSWWAFYDTEALYVFTMVTDFTPQQDSRLPWQDDSIELYIDGDASGGTRYDGRNDFEYILRAGSTDVAFGSRSRRDARGVRVVTSANDHRLVIPWSTIGVVPRTGQAIGIDLHLNDDRDGGERDYKLATFATKDNAWTTPASFGRLVLGRFPEVSADVRGVVDTTDAGGVDIWTSATERFLLDALEGGPLRRDDLSSYFRVLWSPRGLLLLATVYDDLAASDSRSPWDDDSIEIYIDGDNSKGATYDGRNDYQLIIRREDPTIRLGPRSARDTRGIEVVAGTLWGAGHTYSVLVPWSLLGVTPREGHLIGFDLHVNDDDDGGRRDAKLATFARRDDAWLRPRALGTLRLGAATELVGAHRIKGYVYDANSGMPQSGVSVAVRGCDACPVLTAVTDSAGAWRVEGCSASNALALRDGSTALHAVLSKPGYETKEFSLAPAPGPQGYCAELEVHWVLRPNGPPVTP